MRPFIPIWTRHGDNSQHHHKLVLHMETQPVVISCQWSGPCWQICPPPAAGPGGSAGSSLHWSSLPWNMDHSVTSCTANINSVIQFWLCTLIFTIVWVPSPCWNPTCYYLLLATSAFTHWSKYHEKWCTSRLETTKNISNLQQTCTWSVCLAPCRGCSSPRRCCPAWCRWRGHTAPGTRQASRRSSYYRQLLHWQQFWHQCKKMLHNMQRRRREIGMGD